MMQPSMCMVEPRQFTYFTYSGGCIFRHRFLSGTNIMQVPLQAPFKSAEVSTIYRARCNTFEPIVQTAKYMKSSHM